MGVMDYNTGKYIEQLIAKNEVSQSEVARAVGVSRQLLSLIICGKRELSLQLAMKLESYFDLPEGELVTMQAMQSLVQRKLSLRKHLYEQLIAKNAFWSYRAQSMERIPDKVFIEKCLMTLDETDIELLFELFPRKRIQRVWRERMAIQGDHMLEINTLIASKYFGIKEPKKYLARAEQMQNNKLLKYIQG
jgi:plasmid maintenance system antidote protein VapI